jgi:predicted DNA-binding protein
MASKVVSLRFGSQQMERLQRVARRLGRTPSETGALLVEEALRRTEFALIDFRDSIVGRQVYVHLGVG